MDNLKLKNLSVNEDYVVINKVLPTVPFNLIMTGKSLSGKTNFIKNLVTRKDMFSKIFRKKYIYVFTQSYSNTLFSIKGINIFHDTHTVSGLDIIQTLMDAQKQTKEQGKKPKQILIILDDFINHPSLQKRVGFLTKLFSMGRNFNISVILSSQSWMLIPSTTRRMALYSMVWKLTNKKEFNAYIEEMNGRMEEEDFAKLLRDVTEEPYQFLYQDLRKYKYYKNLEQKVFPSN